MTEPWLYIEDGLPEENAEVLVWDTCGSPYICRAVFLKGSFTMGGGSEFKNVIAWIPIIPEPVRIARRKILQDPYNTKNR